MTEQNAAELSQNESPLKWTLEPIAIRLYPDGPVRAVARRPVGSVRLCGIECQIRRASLVDYERLQSKLGASMQQLLQKGLSPREMAVVASIACEEVYADGAKLPPVDEWPLSELSTWAEIARLFLGQGALTLR